MSLVSISRKLSREISQLNTQEAASFTYNPLQYARAPHEDYLKKFGSGPKQILWLGMNPGPFGMTQTGVPFGDVTMVRDWMGIERKIKPPSNQHPKRPILGFDCPRSEVSGTRLWSFARENFSTPESFFSRFFVINYCPLVFMEESGKNLTPDKLPKELRDELYKICDDAFRATVKLLKPQWVLGVGGFAKKRALDALGETPIRIGSILHPSPASPRANRGWAQEVKKQLIDLDISLSPS